MFCSLTWIDTKAEELLPIDKRHQLLDQGNILAKELSDLTKNLKETVDADNKSEGQNVKVDIDTKLINCTNWSNFLRAVAC